MVLDDPRDARRHEGAHERGALVSMMTLGRVAPFRRHEMGEVVKQGREHQLVVGAGARRERRALQRVITLSHRLTVVSIASSSEQRRDVESSHLTLHDSLATLASRRDDGRVPSFGGQFTGA